MHNGARHGHAIDLRPRSMGEPSDIVGTSVFYLQSSEFSL
jgi:hypothetical protein